MANQTHSVPGHGGTGHLPQLLLDGLEAAITAVRPQFCCLQAHGQIYICRRQDYQPSGLVKIDETRRLNYAFARISIPGALINIYNRSLNTIKRQPDTSIPITDGDFLQWVLLAIDAIAARHR
jgi:hypothetical protein